MSLDISLTNPKDDSEEYYTANITHNLNKMAEAAEIYYELWHPDEIKIKKAKQLITPLLNGLKKLHADPEKFRAYNPPNGWGSYENLIEFVEKYLLACLKNPEAILKISN